MPDAPTYDQDFYAWSLAQGNALRERATNALDYDNLAEEIESLGRSERKEIRSRLEIILIHFLKCRYQPEERSRSWEASIHEARVRIADTIEESPSLRAFPAEALARAYRLATLDKAIVQLGLYHLPKECPWTIEQTLDPDFLP